MGHKSMSDGMGPKEGRPAGTLVGVAEVNAVEVRQQWEGGRRRPAGGGGARLAGHDTEGWCIRGWHICGHTNCTGAPTVDTFGPKQGGTITKGERF